MFAATTNLLIYLPLFILIWIPIVIYYWALHRSTYWRRQNVPHSLGTPLFGNLTEIFFRKNTTAVHIAKLYNTFYDKPIFGINLFAKPALVLRDPEIIKRVLVKDFNLFANRHSNSDAKSDVIGCTNLFLLRNPLWRFLRNKLTPIFTSGRIKQMYVLVNEIGNNLNEYMMGLNVNDKTRSIEIELKGLCSRYTMDVISSCAFGVDANSIKDPNSEFIRNGKSMFYFSFYRAMEFFSFFFLPEVVSIFKFKLFSKESSDFLRSTINYVIKERETSGVLRNDLIDTLVTLKQNDMNKIGDNKAELVFKGDILVAQAAVFFTAGFETTASLMSFSLFELAWHQEQQQRLREEIRDMLLKNNGNLSYDNIVAMEYLHMVVSEGARMYPALPFLDRLCELPKSEDGYSLDPHYEFNIPNGMPVLIPIYALHHDPKNFPNPNAFDPERFSKDNKSNIIPYTYLPFGTGPHNCIGERFGLLQVKMGLINFLRNHYVKPLDSTPRKITFEPKSFTLQSIGGIPLEIVRDELCC